MPHVTVERWQSVKDAVELHRRGLDFADALHLSSSVDCEQFVTFDDRGFARRARRLEFKPEVMRAKSLALAGRMLAGSANWIMRRRFFSSKPVPWSMLNCRDSVTTISSP